MKNAPKFFQNLNLLRFADERVNFSAKRKLISERYYKREIKNHKKEVEELKSQKKRKLAFLQSLRNLLISKIAFAKQLKKKNSQVSNTSLNNLMQMLKQKMLIKNTSIYS